MCNSDVLPKERLFNTHCGYIASHLMQAAPLFVPDARPLYSVPLIVSLHSLWNPLMLKMLFCMLCRRSAILVEYGVRVGLFIGIQPSPSTRLGRKYLFYSHTKWVWTSCVTSNSILIQTRVFSFGNLIAATTRIPSSSLKRNYSETAHAYLCCKP